MSLISKFRYNKVTVELHVLPSLLTISSVDCSRFLVTSANEYLLGARLPYFPRGGLSGPGPCNVQGEFQTWQSEDRNRNAGSRVKVLKTTKREIVSR